MKMEEKDELKETPIGEEEVENAGVEKTISQRPESPPNPYNKSGYQFPGQLRDAKNPDTSASDGGGLLEGEGWEKSLLENCCCRPSEKHDDGCCKTAAVRKELYLEIKARVEKALQVILRRM